jgi:hypothetical protein
MLLAFAGLVSATIIFVKSTLFAKIRSVYPTFLSCALCVGFWIGLFGSIFWRDREALTLHVALTHFFTACIVSVLSMTCALILHRLDEA